MYYTLMFYRVNDGTIKYKPCIFRSQKKKKKKKPCIFLCLCIKLVRLSVVSTGAESVP